MEKLERKPKVEICTEKFALFSSYGGKGAIEKTLNIKHFNKPLIVTVIVVL